MKVTLFETGDNCNEIVNVNVAHVTMFAKQELTFNCHLEEEKTKLLMALMKHFVLFKCQGDNISIIPEPNGFQRVRFRFDNNSK